MPSFEDGVFRARWIEVQVPAAQVTATATDFTVTITPDMVDGTFFTGGNTPQADGGDIRVVDSDNATQLPIDLVEYTQSGAPAGRVLVLNVKCDLSAGVAKTLYVYYDTTVASTQPAATSTYGAYNAYDANTVTWYEFETDPAGGTLTNRKQNLYHGTVTGGITQDIGTAPHNGSSWQFGPTSAIEYVVINDGFELLTFFNDNGTFDGTIYPTQSVFTSVLGFVHRTNGTSVSSFHRMFLSPLTVNNAIAQNLPAFGASTSHGATTAASLSLSTWGSPQTTWSDTNGIKALICGVTGGTNTYTGDSDRVSDGFDDKFYINASSRAKVLLATLNNCFVGLMDSIVISDVERSNGWLAMRCSNRTNPGTFGTYVTKGTTPVDFEPWFVQNYSIIGATNA